MILVTNLTDPAERDALREQLEAPCCCCGDQQRAHALFMHDEGLFVFCPECYKAEVPETLASHPNHFGGALVSEHVAPLLIFSLELRRLHTQGRVPLRFRQLYDPCKWASA